MPRRASLERAFLLAALLVFVVGLCLAPVTESDLFFRLKVGQEILARGGLPGTNLFSFTYPEHRDIDPAWLFDVAAALLHRLGGFPAVVVGKTAVVLAAFAGAFALALRRGAGPVAAAAALAGAALVMRERLVERPHVVSFAGEVVALWAAWRLRRPLSRRALAAFGAAVLVWTNAHAGVFAGVAILLLASLGYLGAGDRAAMRRGLLLAGVAVVAAMVTPVGPAGLGRYLLLHLHLPALHPVDEFRRATWRSDAPFFVFTGVAMVVVAGAALAARARGPAAETAAETAAGTGTGTAEMLPVLGMVALGLASVRFAADAALLAAPLLAAGASALWRRLYGGGGAIARALPALAAVSLLAAALAPRAVEARAGGRALDIGLDPGPLPLAAIAFVDRHGLRDRMYNDFEIGSYLAFEGYPRHRVFVDPRLPAYPEEMHRLLGRFDLSRAEWDQAMSRHGVDSALCAYAGVNRRVSWWDPARWALVFRAADARVFVRRLPRFAAVIAAYEIPATFSFTVEHGTRTLPLAAPPAGSPVPSCEWQRRLGDLLFDLDGGAGRARAAYERALAEPGCLPPADEAKLAAFMGGVALVAGDAARALPLLERALALAPGDLSVRANRAAAYQQLGRRAEAAAEWSHIAKEAAGSPLGAAAARAQRQP